MINRKGVTFHESRIVRKTLKRYSSTPLRLTRTYTGWPVNVYGTLYQCRSTCTW